MAHFFDMEKRGEFGDAFGQQTKFDMGIQELRVVDLARRKCLDLLEQVPENAFLLPRTFNQLRIYRIQLNGFLRGAKNENLYKEWSARIEEKFGGCDQQVKDEYASAKNVYARSFRVRTPSKEVVDALLDLYQEISLLKDWVGAGMRLEKQYSERQALKKASE